MHSLIYLSSASYLYSKEEMLEILVKSRHNNEKLGVTGLLLYHEGSILQVLEGEKETVDNLFRKISKDVRHKAILKMLESSIEERTYSEWSMGFQQLSKEQWFQIDGLINLSQTETRQSLASQGTKAFNNIIKSFWYVNQVR